MKFWLGKKNMLSEPASLRTETPGEEKAGKPCCYALPVGTRPRLKQISHKNVKHWVMAEYHMYRTFTTRSLLLSVPPRATTLQSPLQPAPLETEKKKKNHWNAPDKPLSFSYRLLMQSPSLRSNFNHTSYFRLKTESKPKRYCTYNTYYFFRAIKPARQINHKRHLLFFSSALPSEHANR